ncbi:MAG: hypothetical protein AVDCRST_MAG60-175, partial [uncultured Nocardioides sp.]
ADDRRPGGDRRPADGVRVRPRHRRSRRRVPVPGDGHRAAGHPRRRRLRRRGGRGHRGGSDLRVRPDGDPRLQGNRRTRDRDRDEAADGGVRSGRAEERHRLRLPRDRGRPAVPRHLLQRLRTGQRRADRRGGERAGRRRRDRRARAARAHHDQGGGVRARLGGEARRPRGCAGAGRVPGTPRRGSPGAVV